MSCSVRTLPGYHSCSVETRAHCPSTASFHNVTLLLASETARMFPVRDQLHRQTGCLKS